MARSRPRSLRAGRSTTPRRTTSSISPRTRTAIADWAAPACPALSRFPPRKPVPPRGGRAPAVLLESSQEVSVMGDRTQRLKGKTNEVAGKAKAEAGYSTGSGKTEAKGVGKALKGKAQQATGKARSAAKKSTR